MRDAIHRLRRYLREICGEDCRIRLEPEAKKKLPIFLTQKYEVYAGRIFDTDYRLLVSTGNQHPTPGQIQKHSELARSALGPNITFVFTSLPPYDRARLIQRRIPFIVPGAHAYLPTLIVDLREKSKERTYPPGKAKQSLSAPAQLLILFQIQKKQEVEAWPLHQWADVLGYSSMTLSRTYKELVSAKLCEPAERGRTVLLRFPPEKKALWESAYPQLQSPVVSQTPMKIVTTSSPRLYTAGLTALSKFTMISASRDEVYAISSTAFRAAVERRKMIEVPYPEEATAVIQSWRYAPQILSPDGVSVDRLSLFLSFRANRDERIQSALAELLEEISW